MRDTVPCEDGSFDGAITCDAFAELRGQAEIADVCAEVLRVLKPGAPFYVMTGNLFNEAAVESAGFSVRAVLTPMPSAFIIVCRKPR